MRVRTNCLRQENIELGVMLQENSSETLEDELEEGPPEEFYQGNEDGHPYCPHC